MVVLLDLLDLRLHFLAFFVEHFLLDLELAVLVAQGLLVEAFELLELLFIQRFYLSE